MVARHDPECAPLCSAPSLDVPDGRPLVWALNPLGERLPDRVYGPELTARYCARAAERGHRVWLYGGAHAGGARPARRRARRRHPGLRSPGAGRRRTGR